MSNLPPILVGCLLIGQVDLLDPFLVGPDCLGKDVTLGGLDLLENLYLSNLSSKIKKNLVTLVTLVTLVSEDHNQIVWLLEILALETTPIVFKSLTPLVISMEQMVLYLGE